SIVEFTDRENRVPDLIAFGFAAYLLFVRGDLHDRRRIAGFHVPLDEQSFRIRELWRSNIPPVEIARRACSDTDLWGLDLTEIPGFAESVASHLSTMTTAGVKDSLENLLFHPAPLRTA
ncbi:MAG TPA: hypothetical protein VM939_13680, partial [Gemmatimonadaceae bacterium]|nr:hypothetical protein [Gemmatimonadaceae bacterium]